MDDDVDLGVSSERLADEVATLAGHIAAATYRLLLLIGEIDRRGVWAEWGCLSCAHRLNWQIGLEFRTAREHVRVAHRLTELPLVAAAFREGTISYSKVRALCRIANPATEADLVMIAHSGTASHVERIARAYRRSVALSAPAADTQHDKRYGRWQWDDGPALTPETVRRIACDTATVTVTEHPDRTIQAGRRTRTIPNALHRALHVRDGGCRFPGCTSRRYTDGHHIQHWANGGPTTLANLILLCRHHHRHLHEGHWTIHTTDTGYTFTDPHGHQLPAQPPRKHGDIRAIRHPHITPDTIRTRWGGERLDLHMVIENLRWHDEHPVPRNRPMVS